MLKLSFTIFYPQNLLALLFGKALPNLCNQFSIAERFAAAQANHHPAVKQLSGKLATVSGVSALRLYGAFKSYRGYSPLELVKKLRSRRRRMP